MKHFSWIVRSSIPLLVVLLLGGCSRTRQCGGPSHGAGSSGAAAAEPIVTKLGIEMVLIPAGEFVMGDDNGEEDERPAHRRKVSAFYMDVCEVTQKSYQTLMGRNPAKFLDSNGPVERVSWLSAVLYCNVRSLREGRQPCYDKETLRCEFSADGYRLPTEAEWEYACRAGTTTRWSFGNDPRRLGSYAYFKENSTGKAHPVKQKKPNPWGLYDMHGNVAEWCNDFISESYDPQGEVQDPRPPASGEERVLRGGSWASSAEACRSSARNSETPRFADACFGTEMYGFRCVRRVTRPKETHIMKSHSHVASLRLPPSGLGLWLLPAIALGGVAVSAAAELSDELKSVGHKIVYETFQENNWELFVSHADGSHPVNLTRTPTVNELYPHVSPDGKKICFVCDEGEGAAKIRNVYYMNLDGSGRTLVAKNARQPCWRQDSEAIAYLKGELDRFVYTDYATKGIFIYDLASRLHAQHPNQEIRHLYNLCWSPDGKWFLATVHAGMGYRHAILAIEAEGTKVFDLKLPGCRPDISPDGKRLAWGPSDWALRVGDLDFSGPTPKVVHARDVVTSRKPMKVYHIDFSPDGKYVSYSRGPATKRLGQIPELVGVRSEGWDIYVADPAQINRSLRITTDGRCNKEPDWVPVETK